MDLPTRKWGRVPLKVTDEQRMEIQRLSGFGTPIREIAAIMGISQASLYKHCREDLLESCECFI